jgi:Na+/H+ antiporter NhaC
VRAALASLVVLLVVGLWSWATILSVEDPTRHVPAALNAAGTIAISAGVAYAFRMIGDRKKDGGDDE